MIERGDKILFGNVRRESLIMNKHFNQKDSEDNQPEGEAAVNVNCWYHRHIKFTIQTMSKNRKTRKEKIRSDMRRKESDTFQVKEEWLNAETKNVKETVTLNETGRRFLKLDLTKTFFLSMLVLALEIALWQYFLRH